MINDSTKHRLFIVSGQSISLICCCCESKIPGQCINFFLLFVKIRYLKQGEEINLGRFILGWFYFKKSFRLPDVFIVRYENAKCVKEITRGSVMGRYFKD